MACKGNSGVESVFQVKTCFNSRSIPEKFTTGSWEYNGQTIPVDYQTR